ncbi:AgmX/PglI C-terminal domain-containing protein [Marinobacter hydrocarbonoclasticus]|uniref:AgmX/PglI C-terminal domain-containing protein n=1 Tax=Marinobacter nauticus TaxID=2743 RepID=UPI001A8DCD0F|nr:AgmX/PglI C-terminal domain-containing protein [Marinobacter nauticus]MBN8238108.1 AgmX/PglI C-terminal domain-containing protein [Marinobacter nauticus]
MVDRRELSQPSRLPWSRDRAESGRFGLITGLMLALFLIPALIIPGLQVPEPEREQAEQLPPRLAKLVQPPKPVEPPEPVVEPEPEQSKPEPEPKRVEAPQQIPPEPTVAKSKPEPEPEPAPQTTEQARETASRSGLFAMKDRLSALTSLDTPAPEVRRVANVSNSKAVGLAPETSSDTVLQGSGGVETREGPVREVELAKHETSDVAAPRETAPQVASQPEPARPSVGERAMSNIRQVFDAQKSVLYSLYQRELRQDPTLEGKVTLELVIEPDGSVSACDVVGSELDHPMLEKRIALRVQMFNFGAANVETRKVRFPIDFLPG